MVRKQIFLDRSNSFLLVIGFIWIYFPLSLFHSKPLSPMPSHSIPYCRVKPAPAHYLCPHISAPHGCSYHRFLCCVATASGPKVENQQSAHVQLFCFSQFLRLPLALFPHSLNPLLIWLPVQSDRFFLSRPGEQTVSNLKLIYKKSLTWVAQPLGPHWSACLKNWSSYNIGAYGRNS